KKIHVTHRFVLGFVPYLFAGFQAHVHSGYGSDSNAIKTLVACTRNIVQSSRILFTSFLCSHRDPKIGCSVNLLQQSIPSEKIRRASSLSKALAHNASETTRATIVFLQQSPTAKATSSIFPEVTVEYIEKGEMLTMLSIVEYQFDHVKNVLAGNADRLKSRLVTLDVLTVRIERFLEKRFGADWRYKDFTSADYDGDRLVQIAVHMALPGIERMMPFFSGEFQKNVLARKSELIKKNARSAYARGGERAAHVVTDAIKWFMLQHSMTISAKAVYETAFYYLWGSYIGKSESAFSIGLDREHDRFQHYAWELGAKSASNDSDTHLLYARRNPSGGDHGNLSEISLRQFWRHEK
ncbi:MAG TPA: hypothetical protein VM260_03600, partial [Pirellula sp.]|nr:hypothetical protein [Pirellula sp.]